MIWKTTLAIEKKVVGLILAAIAIEFIIGGLAQHFPNIVSFHDNESVLLKTAGLVYNGLSYE